MNSQDKLTQLLSQFGENEVVEFKEAKTSYDFGKLGKYFSALSNEVKRLDIEHIILDKLPDVLNAYLKRSKRQTK